VNTLFRILILALLALNCRAAIVPIQETVFTTNTFDTDIVGGAIPYFDFPSGKFVASPTAYSNALFYDPALGFLSIVHTNDTGDLLLNLAVAGAAGQSIQAYADKFVVANTNLTFDAVGPYSIRLRINGSNVLEAVAGSISLSGQTNLVADNGSSLTYNGVAIGGAVVGTMVESGISADGVIPKSNGSSGTNFTASPMMVTGTNVASSGGLDLLGNLSFGGMPFGFHNFFYRIPNTDLAYITNIYSKNIPAGDISILTVPVGYRFLLFKNIIMPTNTSISSSWISVLTNGVTTRLRQATAVPTNGTLLSVGSGNNFVFEQNETLVLHCSTNLQRTGFQGLVFTNSIPLKSYRNLALSGGDNVLYTVPANTFDVAYVPDGLTFQHNLEYFNGTAGSVTNAFYIIPNGETKNINTKWTTSVAATLINGGTSLPPILFPGDSILLELSSSASGQVAWLTVWEQ